MSLAWDHFTSGPAGGHGEAAPTATEATHAAQAPRVTQFRGPGGTLSKAAFWSGKKPVIFLLKESMQLESFFFGRKIGNITYHMYICISFVFLFMLIGFFNGIYKLESVTRVCEYQRMVELKGCLKKDDRMVWPPKSLKHHFFGSIPLRLCLGLQRAILPGTPNHIFNGCLVKTSISQVKVWNYLTETTILKWMFRAPCAYYIRCFVRMLVTHNLFSTLKAFISDICPWTFPQFNSTLFVFLMFFGGACFWLFQGIQP